MAVLPLLLPPQPHCWPQAPARHRWQLGSGESKLSERRQLQWLLLLRQVLLR